MEKYDLSLGDFKEIIKPELDRKLRQEIMLDLYFEWLEQQKEQVQIVSQIETSSKTA